MHPALHSLVSEGKDLGLRLTTAADDLAAALKRVSDEGDPIIAEMVAIAKTPRPLVVRMETMLRVLETAMTARIPQSRQ